jgi:hypothetical protein
MRTLGLAVVVVAMLVWFVVVHAVTHHYIAGQSYRFIAWHLGVAFAFAGAVCAFCWWRERRRTRTRT